MTRKFKRFGLILLLLLLGISVFINIYMMRNGVPLGQGTVILPPDLTQALLADLKAGDKARMEAWWWFFNQFTDTNYNVVSTGLEQTFQLYQSKEKPGRSNYFNRMVFELHAKQANLPMSKSAIVGFLGTPDAVSQERGAQVLDYAYQCAGRQFLTLVIVTNGIVQKIEICSKPPGSISPPP